jgi:adenosylhomocysteine nucleosidase
MAIAEAYNKKIILIKSGMGKVNAAVAAVTACQNNADLIITTGLAGGIDSVLEQGDIVLADRVCYHDVWCGEENEKGQVQDLPLYYEAPEDVIKAIKKKAPSFKVGLTVTGDQFVTDKDKLAEIKKDFPEAYATDMESAAIAQTCYLLKVPYLSLRIISDVVGKVGQVEEYLFFREQMPIKASNMVDTVLQVL